MPSGSWKREKQQPYRRVRLENLAAGEAGPAAGAGQEHTATGKKKFFTPAMFSPVPLIKFFDVVPTIKHFSSVKDLYLFLKRRQKWVNLELRGNKL